MNLVAGRLEVKADMSPSSGRISPLSRFKRIGLFFRRQNSEPALTRSDQLSSKSKKDKIFGKPLAEICTPELPNQIMVSKMMLTQMC